MKSKKIRKYVENLLQDELQEVFSNFNQLENNGKIGDCLLRSISEQISKDNDGNVPLILWMNFVANECYRMVAEKSIEKWKKIIEE